MNEEKEDAESENLREIPKWTRRYAQSRTLPFVLQMIIFVLLCAAIGGPSYLAVKAYLSGNIILLVICIVVLVTGFAGTIFFSVPKWGGKLIGEIAQRLYGKEGSVAISPAEGLIMQPVVPKIATWLFASCVFASIVLGMLGFYSIEYMQPVSAIYVVPFLVFLGIGMKGIAGLIPLLWPGLYALHAILVVAGVPIQFEGKLMGLNMLIPIAGYGIFTGLVGHIYNRFALRKLKNIACLEESGNSIETEIK